MADVSESVRSDRRRGTIETHPIGRWLGDLGVGPSALLGAVIGAVVVSAIRALRLIALMPLDWLIAAWTGAASLGLVSSLVRQRLLLQEVERLNEGEGG